MPSYLARMCAISLQLFAKGCIECSGAIPLSAPGPVDLPALCAGSGIAQKRQKNAEGLGRRSAFFLGARLVGVVGDKEVKPGHKAVAGEIKKARELAFEWFW